MAERPEDRRQARPIVPDPDASLAPHRLRQPPPPRLWPLWCLMVILLAGTAALAWFGWQERLRLQAELTRVSGEVSNVHARFDAEEGRGEALEAIRSRLDDLEGTETRLEEGVEERQEAVDDRLTAIDERLDDLADGLATQADEGETRQALMASLRQSLDALERVGEEGRATLAERLEVLAAEAGDSEAVEDLADRQASIEERLASLAERQEGLSETLEEAIAERDDARERGDEQDDRLASLEDEVDELRRGQVALSAQIEALQP